MKINSRTLITALLMMFGVVKAQTNTSWTPVLVNVDGTNTFKGVEVYYSLSTCGADEVVFLKLVNTNAKAMKAQWINDVVTNDTKEHYGKTKLVSVNINANSEIIGSCKSKVKELIIKLKKYDVEAKDFNTIVGSSFYAE